MPAILPAAWRAPAAAGPLYEYPRREAVCARDRDDNEYPNSSSMTRLIMGEV